MSPTYQGRALRNRPVEPASPFRTKLVRLAQALGGVALVVALAHVPWGTLRHQLVPVAEVRVDGLHYLDAAAVVQRSGLAIGAGWLEADLGRARQRLLADSRIRSARVARAFPNAIAIHVEERVPVLLVRHGGPWELDGEGVLLAPLSDGVVADVPLVTGLDAARYRAGTCIGTATAERALAWVRATGDPQLELAGRISEFDVSDAAATTMVLMDGTRVLAPAWPPALSKLSSLRVVLATLGQRGIPAQEIDLRFQHQVIVRPADAGAGAAEGTQPS